MNKAIKIIAIGIDKIAHFGLGYMIADIFEFAGLWALLIATGVGVMKELLISMLSTQFLTCPIWLSLLAGRFWQSGLIMRGNKK